MLSVDEIINIINVVPVDKESRSEILKRINDLEKEKKEERENSKVPKPKKEAAVIIKCFKEGITSEDLVAAVFMVDEGTDMATVVPSLISAATDFNVQRKKKKPILTLTEILQMLKPRFFKNYKLKRITQEWCQTIVISDEQDKSLIDIKTSD